MVTIGPLKIFRHQEFDIVQTTVDRPETEVARFDSARNTACAKMEQFYQEAVSHVGLDNAFIFKAKHGQAVAQFLGAPLKRHKLPQPLET